MKFMLFFLGILSFSQCDMKTTGYSTVAESTMPSDTSDLAITIVHNPKFAYGVEVRSKNTTSPILIKKIIFAASEVNYPAGCEAKPYSKCSSEYCYLPTYGSGSRLHVYPVSDSLLKPVCRVYYSVGGKAKVAFADSISITPCKIAAIPGIEELGYPCYWLNGCND